MTQDLIQDKIQKVKKINGFFKFLLEPAMKE